MEELHINHWAVLACAATNLILGAFWYSPMLFYRAWKEENHFTEADIKNFKPARTYTITCILSLVISYSLALFLGDRGTHMGWGALTGFLAGFGFAAMIFIIVALFEQRSWKYIMINGGYIVTYFTLAGSILGAWR